MQHQYPHCERVFSRRSALRNHIKTHINEIDRILEKIAEESTHDVEMIDFDKQNDPVDYESQALLNVEEDEELIDIEEEEDIDDIDDVDDVEEMEEEQLINVEEESEEKKEEKEKEEEEEEEKQEEEQEEEKEEEEKLIDDDQVRFILNYISISSSTKSLF